MQARANSRVCASGARKEMKGPGAAEVAECTRARARTREGPSVCVVRSLVALSVNEYVPSTALSVIVISM